MSLRKRIAALAKPKIAPVEMADGEKLYVRELSGAERDAIGSMFKGDDKALSSDGWRGRLAALFLCEENGDRIYNAADDAAELNGLSGSFLERIIDAGNEVSGLGAKGVDAAKANFPSAPSADSSSGSPEKSAA